MRVSRHTILELKKILSQTVFHSACQCVDEKQGEVETYPPGSTVLVVTVFNQGSRNTGDDGANNSQAPNNLEFFHHIIG